MPAQSRKSHHMSVTAIRNGTVIDHIHNAATFKVAEILHLSREDNVVLVGMNLPSDQVGTKGIIKVEGRELTLQEVNKIALIAPEATLNIIKDYEVAEKRKVEVPSRVEGIVRCFNPNCITNHQGVGTCFDVVGYSPITLRCVHCERTMSGDDIILK
jgi:aspartate carbamoyltransferase regulatory subunit